jgi:hypothetical protein
MAPISRISLACESCRLKKSRCSGQKPICDNCVKAGVDCSYNARSDSRKPYSKAFVSTLQARINSLEKELARYTSVESGSAKPGEEARKGQHHTPEPSTRARPLNETELVGQLAKRGGNLLRHADTNLSDQQGTLRFYGASSSRNFAIAHQPDAFDFADLVRQSRVRLSTLGYADGIDRSNATMSLYKAYFDQINPILMLLEEDIFYDSLSKGDAGTHTSPLLLNAVSACGAFASRDKSSCEAYLDRARLLLEVETASPQLTTIQALILMGYCEAACGRESRGWAYIGMSSRIALELGLPRDSHEYVEMKWMTSQDMRARHRTLWSLFILDQLLSLYYGRPASLDARIISVPAPSPTKPAHGSLSLPCPRPQSCSSCHRFDDLTISTFELTNYAVEIYHRLYANPILKADASSRWTGWASDLNLRLAQWCADLPRPLKCTFTRGQVPKQSIMTLHLIYHSLVILLNRPFLPLGVQMSEAAFSAKASHLASRAIARLMTDMETHYRLESAHNYCVYILHTAITIAILNSKSSMGTVQREARNDLRSLIASLHRLSFIHLNAANIYRLIVALIRRTFVNEREWVESLCGASNESAVRAVDSNSLTPVTHRGAPTAAKSQVTSLFPMDINALLQQEQGFSNAELSQFAFVDWDSFSGLGGFGDNFIAGIDIQPWLK